MAASWEFPENIDVTEVDAAVVSQAIATVEEIGCKSIDASEMLETAKIIFQLRTLVLDKKWTEIYDFINTRAYESKFQPHAFAVEEIDLAQSEAVDVSVTYHLTNCIKRGKLEFKNGVFNLNCVATGMLESAIKYASDSECTSERVSSLQKHATFTLNLRKMS